MPLWIPYPWKFSRGGVVWGTVLPLGTRVSLYYSQKGRNRTPARQGREALRGFISTFTVSDTMWDAGDNNEKEPSPALQELTVS